MPEFDVLQQRLGYEFRDSSLLRLALTHPSVAHDPRQPLQHNQRLEFLGDAVLQLVLTRQLYEKFPGFGEGALTKARAKLVNRHALALQSRELGVGLFLILSRGEELQGARERASALADAFEAVAGAIFLDGGFEVARKFILRQFKQSIGELEATPVIDNPKGELQEILQASASSPPEYHIISVLGPHHDRLFECTVQHCGVELARGWGKSKKSAESDAALAALKVLRLQPGENGNQTSIDASLETDGNATEI